jgi:hypothetical protein
MAASVRQRIIEAFLTRVLAIATADGFDTDAGRTVFLGEAPQLGESDPSEAIALVVGDDQVKYQGVNLLIALPISIQALAKADLEQPWLAAEAVLGDIKRAVELADRTLGGLVQRQFERGTTRALPRVPGSTTVGIVIEYQAPYVEAWGNP